MNRIRLSHEFRFLAILYLLAYSLSELLCIATQGFSFMEDSPYFFISLLIFLYSKYFKLFSSIVFKPVPRSSNVPEEVCPSKTSLLD